MKKKPISKRRGSDRKRLSRMTDSEIPEIRLEQFARAVVRRGDFFSADEIAEIRRLCESSEWTDWREIRDDL